MTKRFVTKLVVYNVVLLILAAVLANLNRTSLIILFGVVLTNVLLIAGWIVLGAAFVVGNGLFVANYLRKRAKLRAVAHPMELTFNPRDAQDPANIRLELEKYKTERPALAPQLDQALTQMDSIDRKQAKLKEIFERNAVATLDDVGETVDETEQSICRNLTRILNRAILWDPLEHNKPGKEEIYKNHLLYMQKNLDRNEEMLTMCDTLLAETVSYVDEKNAGVDNSQLHLQTMTSTVQTLRHLNGKDD